jgi:alpha-amylase/alpha-mannosidase (GH57 family)
MERFVCIHGHFYQPPRENPWLEAVEVQESAYPFHDWNERITEECYGPNARARILDGEGWITSIVDNYSRMSFNFGPTLLSWLEERQPGVYAAILESDRLSAARFGGHGSAMAQGYGHIILPLANERDRRTQAIWGVRDFERRFGRKPEGMWLPETAVNIGTLEALAEQGVRFTVLAPRQARRVRAKDRDGWEELGEGGIDPSRAYEQLLPSGKSIAIFFYDGPISNAVAFERLLESGEKLSSRVLGGFDESRSWAQLAHIATDGETYGHHHKHGEMALAFALDQIERTEGVRLTNYGEFLERFPPTHLVEIAEDTSWSCAHGVERWKSDCGCNTGGHPEWSQAWRAPLRAALDWLRDAMAPKFEEAARPLLKDPWAARDDYISVVLDRSPESVRAFFDRHRTRELCDEETTRALKLLELQRHAMLMYTSCGWFFDELSGIETVQVIQYAGRVVQLGEDLFGSSAEGEFLARLEQARSNIAEQGNGRQIYDRIVRPAMVDLSRVAAHYAISSLFEDHERESRVFSFDATSEDHSVASAGRARLAVGLARLTSRITRESGRFSYAVLHMGDHVLNAGVRPFAGEDAYRRLATDARDAFDRADFPGVIRAMDGAFGGSGYTLASLFRDEQHGVMRLVLEPVLAEVDASYRQVYDSHAALMRFLARMSMPIPRRLRTAAQFVLNGELQKQISDPEPRPERIRQILEEARSQGVPLDDVTLGYAMRRAVERSAARWREAPESIDALRALDELVAVARELPFYVELSRVQNTAHEIMGVTLHSVRERASAGDPGGAEWVHLFGALAERLKMRVPS